MTLTIDIPILDRVTLARTIQTVQEYRQFKNTDSPKIQTVQKYKLLKNTDIPRIQTIQEYRQSKNTDSNWRKSKKLTCMH